MSRSHKLRSHRRKSFRASRSLRFYLLSLGLTALVIGLGLFVYGHTRANVRVKSFALVYCAVAVVTLGLRQAMRFRHNLRKRKQVQAEKLKRGLRPAVQRPKLNRSP